LAVLRASVTINPSLRVFQQKAGVVLPLPPDLAVADGSKEVGEVVKKKLSMDCFQDLSHWQPLLRWLEAFERRQDTLDAKMECLHQENTMLKQKMTSLDDEFKHLLSDQGFLMKLVGRKASFTLSMLQAG
jgi:hypothetical protein